MVSIKSLTHLNHYLNEFEYGIPYNGRVINPEGKEFAKLYHYLSPEEFQKYGCGICWDYAAYQAQVLNEQGAKYNNFYVEVGPQENPDTHTFTVVKLGNKFVYIESSFRSIQGVYVSSRIKDIIGFVIFHMISDQKYKDSDIIDVSVRIYKENKKYGSNTIEFMRDMKKFPIIIKLKRRKDSFKIGNSILKLY